jgi:hypothetical protein
MVSDVNDEQPVKHLSPRDVTVFGILSDSNDEHPSKQ